MNLVQGSKESRGSTLELNLAQYLLIEPLENGTLLGFVFPKFF